LLVHSIYNATNIKIKISRNL